MVVQVFVNIVVSNVIPANIERLFGYSLKESTNT